MEDSDRPVVAVEIRGILSSLQSDGIHIPGTERPLAELSTDEVIDLATRLAADDDFWNGVPRFVVSPEGCTLSRPGIRASFSEVA